MARQFFKLWFGVGGIETVYRDLGDDVPAKSKNPHPPYYIGAPATVEKIDNRIKKLCPPVEIRRMVRILKELPWYKAKEFENLVLQFIVPLLKDILPPAVLLESSLLKSLHVIPWLLKSKIHVPKLDIAENLLIRFVQQVETLYVNGDAEIDTNNKACRQMTFNVHILLHVTCC